VDRTPFHHYWLIDRIKGKQTDVRLLKKFLKSSSLYGAEYSVRGFSGYLCELLIIFFGSFRETVMKCRNLTRNTVIDVNSGEFTKKKGLDNILVIDPVDEKRNVAANLSLDKLAEFVEKCRNFVESPSIDFFHEKEKPEVSKELLEQEIKDRNTGLYVIEFEKPDIVKDNLYPQLERACKKITEHLSRNKLMPLRSGYFAGKMCYLVFETEVKEISAIERRSGPVFEDYENVKKFVTKRREYVPFIEGGRYYVYARRKCNKTENILKDFIRKEGKYLGKNIGEKLTNFTLLKNAEILELDDEFNKYLVEFLTLSRR
jgi:tRNA nucleotidyltransferase (CCA-adding enzyme)